MQRFAIIGLGRFGARLASNLAEQGQDVIGIDKDRGVVEDMRDRLTLAIAMDGTDEQALLMQGIDKVDVAVVGIGGDFESIVLATVVLKQLGVKRVIARAISSVGAKVLRSIGADQVVNPEDESADRWADHLVYPQFLSKVMLGAEHSVVEMKTPKQWVGKSLVDLHLRQKRNVIVLAIKPPDAKPDGQSADDEDDESPETMRVPDPDQPLEEGEILVLYGSDDALAAITEGR